MSAFSPEWLALRDVADRRARNADLAAAAGRLLAGIPNPRIVDLGAGTGANLRALAPLLGPRQSWRLLDHDAALLAEARRALAAWADRADAADGAGLVLRRDGREITVSFAAADLAGDLSAITEGRPHLVTASAFFDLVSAPWIDRFAGMVAASGAAFYTVLTCDGRDRWMPPYSADGAVAAAFRHDQGHDKGFGPAAGNGASDALEAAFRARGHGVARADSPWRLGPEDAALIAALARGTAAAAAATGLVSPAEAQDWAEARVGAACVIGHTDLLAWPGAGVSGR